MNENSNLQITEEIKAHLSETGKWAQFLSIIGFIGVAFLVLAAIFMGSMFSTLSAAPGAEDLPRGFGGILAFFYVVIAALYFFPVWYQFKFSTKIRAALNSDDNAVLTEAFSNLKKYYKFMGIMTIVVLSMYVLAIIGAAVFGASMVH